MEDYSDEYQFKVVVKRKPSFKGKKTFELNKSIKVTDVYDSKGY